MCKIAILPHFLTHFIEFLTKNVLKSDEMLFIGVLSYFYNHLYPFGAVLAHLYAYKGRCVQKTRDFELIFDQNPGISEIPKNGQNLKKKGLFLLFPHQMGQKNPTTIRQLKLDN